MSVLEHTKALGKASYALEALESENAKLKALLGEAVRGLEELSNASSAYDKSILGRAANGEFDLMALGGGIATGPDLDALYLAWQQKAGEARALVQRIKEAK